MKVQVLMSTFNGESYIDEQVESIMNQKDVDVFLIIRDDGSKDKTVLKIKQLQKIYPNKIELIEGTNIGYRKSFLSLFDCINDCMDYYAYADQDDVWLPEKLKCGVEKLSQKDNVWLYSSALTITDEELKVIDIKKQDNIRQTLQSFFIRTRLAGCTYIFTPELAKIGSKYSKLNADNEKMPDHDCLLCMLSMLYQKKILIDDKSFILHRRTRTSETSGAGIKKRFQVEWNRIFKRKHCYQYTADLLLDEMSDIYSKDVYMERFLNYVSASNHNFRTRMKLIFDSQFSCGILLADILIRIKVLLRYY